MDKQKFGPNIIQENIKSGFKVIRIWPFNPKAMDGKTKPSKVHTMDAINISNENIDDFDGPTSKQEEPKEDGATTQLLNITTIVQEVGIENHDEQGQLNIRYYIQKPMSPIATLEIGQTTIVYD